MRLHLVIAPLALLLALQAPCVATAQSSAAAIPDPAAQIALAVRPLPDTMKAGAAVRGYAPDGKSVMLRPGTNDMICLAQDPKAKGFHVACYHRDLEPFMARGRELRAQGKKRAEVDSIRQAEIENGRLALPRRPTALYELFGGPQSWNAATANVTGDVSPVYVLYIPYATEATTGLSAAPAGDGVPWLMYPGTPWAHVMIVPRAAK